MTKKHKTIKCSVCSVKIKKEQICYYHTSKVCKRCYNRLTKQNSGTPATESNHKLSFIDKLIKKYGIGSKE